MRSEAADVADVAKEHRVRVWWSLYGLECSLNESTGRPSCISDKDMSTPLPINVNEEDLHRGQLLYERLKDIPISGPASPLNEKAPQGKIGLNPSGRD